MYLERFPVTNSVHCRHYTSSAEALKGTGWETWNPWRRENIPDKDSLSKDATVICWTCPEYKRKDGRMHQSRLSRR